MDRVRSLDAAGKARVREGLVRALRAEPDVSFALLHGSFRDGPFRDVDVAVFLHPDPDAADRLRRELALSRILSDATGLPVDVHALNTAPLPFRFNALRAGDLLLVRDEARWDAFARTTLALYHDFQHHRHAYLRDALGLEV